MGIIRRGVHRPLEDEANRIIKESLFGVTKHSDKADILTPWKAQARYRREVYVASGIPDQSVRQGMFNRVVNTHKPELNSRDGLAGPRTGSIKSLSDFVDMEGDSYD
jgi:hypothetical protein